MTSVAEPVRGRGRSGQNLSPSSMDDVIDRRIGETCTFARKQEDWLEWHSVFKSWIMMLSPEMHEKMQIACASAGEGSMEEMAAETKARSGQLFQFLDLMVKGRASDILRYPGSRNQMNGYEGVWLIKRHFKLDSASRTMGVLQAVLNPLFSGPNKWIDEMMTGD